MLSGIIMDLLGITSVFYVMGAISLVGTGVFYLLTSGYEQE
jgi:hypothetical protein